MDQPSEPCRSTFGSLRRDTMSTMSSERQPSLPSGRWPLTIHGNCARCGHHHKAAMIEIHVIEGVCEASHVVCDRCGQKWLTIGGLNSTQISLLSTLTTEMDSNEINFRNTLFNIVRSATSVALPTALPNVPEDPSPAPSRRSTSILAREEPEPSNKAERTLLQKIRAIPLPVAHVESEPPPTSQIGSRGQDPPLRPPHGSAHALVTIQRKFQKTMDVLKKVRLKRFLRKAKVEKWTTETARRRSEVDSVTQGRLESSEIVGSIRLEDGRQSKPPEDATCTYEFAKTTEQIIDDLKAIDKEAILCMTPKQSDVWIRERITAFKRSKCCSANHCGCKRRHSAPSIRDAHSLLPHRSATTTPTFQRYSLEQMGSQFDMLPIGALFTHTGPLTISASRISEADTAVENQEGSSSPRSSQHPHSSRSPRPASWYRSRFSWNQSRHTRTQRDSMDSMFAGTTRSSWRGLDRLSLASISVQDVMNAGQSAELPSSTSPVMEEDVSTNSQESRPHT